MNNKIARQNERENENDLISKWLIRYKGMTSEDIRKGFLNNLEYNIAKDQYTLTPYDKFLSLSYTVRERLIERWILTQQKYHKENPKRVYYLSLEFLMGRLLGNNAINLGIEDECSQAMADLSFDMENIEEEEFDAGLGNGGLGRLAACFLDSMATLQLPAIGYGIRYEFGIFNQKIINGYQQELPERWLQNTNPWEIERPEYKVNVKLYGKTTPYDHDPSKKTAWTDTDDVIAVPYDVPIPGFKNNTVNTLRLWSSRSAYPFRLEQFNTGDYIGACESKISSENISKVLYPNDSNHSGKELRLKQQYFFTSASLQDIIRRFLKHNNNFYDFPKYNAIQLNDTHPAISIAELMRLLIDEYDQSWDEAWDIVTRTFAYTNHTLMPEALEKWSVSLLKNLLPRPMEIIYEINSRFLRQVAYKYPGDTEKLSRMSLIEEGEDPQVRMAYLAIIGSHSVNGVAELHSKLLTDGLVREFYELWPEKFNNKTNGVTQRRWLYRSNPSLRELITSKIGSGWIKNLNELKKLESFAEDKEFQKQWRDVKLFNKQNLANKLKKWHDFEINPNSMFDVQIKRIHEYKRQLLNVFHGIHLYNRIKNKEMDNFVPRTIMIGGKAAPGYAAAKLIIKFINNVANTINDDPDTNGLLRMYFVPNYRVSMAEVLIPATDLSEQISTAGTEASGTGNMKFGLNGALTIGTMDGANIEMLREVGDDNMFIFGLHTNEVRDLLSQGYVPQKYYDNSSNLKRVIDLISSNFFSPEENYLFSPILENLFNADPYMIFADFDSYVKCQEDVNNAYLDEDNWTKMAILNVANMGKFSSDRTITEYANEIWDAKPVNVTFKK